MVGNFQFSEPFLPVFRSVKMFLLPAFCSRIKRGESSEIEQFDNLFVTAQFGKEGPAAELFVILLGGDRKYSNQPFYPSFPRGGKDWTCFHRQPGKHLGSFGKTKWLGLQVLNLRSIGATLSLLVEIWYNSSYMIMSDEDSVAPMIL